MTFSQNKKKRKRTYKVGQMAMKVLNELIELC